MSIVINKGEICLAGTRTFVHEKVLDVFTEKFQDILRKIRIGDPMSPSTQLGAQVSQGQLEKILNYIDIGQSEGARMVLGGKRAMVDGFEKGLFIEPTLFVDVRNDMRIAREEIFGPVAVVIPWSNENDVIQQANDSEYGLAGGIWTRDLVKAHKMAKGLETGTVFVNRYYNMMVNMPIGGYKQSGFGREFSHDVLNHYTQLKSVIVSLQEGPIGMFNH